MGLTHTHTKKSLNGHDLQTLSTLQNCNHFVEVNCCKYGNNSDGQSHERNMAVPLTKIDSLREKHVVSS